MALAPKTVYTYPLDGSNRTFAINFEYLTRKFVQITLIGQDRKLLVLNQDYRFVTRTSIQTTIAWGPAQGYETIEIRRFTSATDRLVDFSDGSILRAYDLNISSVQALHIAEEARDLSADTIAVNNDGDLDARGRRIVNLADATDPSHAVTLRQEQEWSASTLSNRNAAEASANASAQSASGSSAARDRAIQAENRAKEWAVAPTEIDGDQYSSRSWALASGRYADDAKASAKVATDEIAKIDGQIDIAKGHADRSKTEADRSAERAASSAASANRANNSAISAAGDADKAKQSEANVALAQVPLFSVTWWPGKRTGIPLGFIPADGQKILKTAFPGIAAGIGSTVDRTNEDWWVANPTYRGYWAVATDGVSLIVPDLNGKAAGSVGATFLRGDGAGTTTEHGIIQRDQTQGYRLGHSAKPGFELHGLNSGYPGASNSQTLFGAYLAQRGTADFSPLNPVDDGTNGVPRVGKETRPIGAVGCWIIKAFGAVLPVSSLEVQTLMNSIAAQNVRVSALESRMLSLGEGQTWKDMLSQRTWGTTYTNDTGRSIQVIVRLQQLSTSLSNFYVNDLPLGFFGQSNVEGGGQCSAIIPPGSNYRLTDGRGRNTLFGWFELRT